MPTRKHLRTCLVLLTFQAQIFACGSAENTPAPDATPSCGNLIVDPNEECDGITSAQCSDVGHNAGFPTCTDQCEVSYDACETLTAIDIDQAGGVTCVITEEEGLDCWGDNRGGVAEEPQVGPVSQLTTCGGNWCGLIGDGRITCRAVPFGQPRGSHYRAMGCHFARLWGITESGSVVVAAPDKDADLEAMTKYQAFDGTRLVDLNLALECGLYNDGAVVCLDPVRQARLSDWRVKELIMADPMTNGVGVPEAPLICGLNFDGTAQCVSELATSPRRRPHSPEKPQ